MERNAIQEFVDNLTIEKDITKDEAIDLKETLELNAKDIEPSRIANFIKSVQERMDATASDIFSGNGINIESVKLIAKRAAKEIKIEQIRFSENERIQNEKKLREQEQTINEINKEVEKNRQEKENAEIQKNLEWIEKNHSSGSIVVDLEMAERMRKVKEQNKKYNDAIRNGASRDEVIARVEADRAANPDKEGQAWDDLATLESMEMDAELMLDTNTPNSKENALGKVFTNNFMAQAIFKEHIIYTPEGKVGIRISKEVYDNLPSDLMLRPIDRVSDNTYMDTYNIDYSKDGTGKKGIIDRFAKKYKPFMPESPSIDEKKEETPEEKAEEDVLISTDGLSLSQKLYLIRLSLVERLRSRQENRVKETEKEIEEISQKDVDINTSDLPDKMVEIVKRQRKIRALELEYYEDLHEYNPKIENIKENTLEKDKEKKAKIIEMYFKEGKSAIEIYEELSANGEIEEKYLIPQDVIDVVAKQARLTIPMAEVKKLVEREQEIEELTARRKSYEIIMNNGEKSQDPKVLKKDLVNATRYSRNILSHRIKDKKEERSRSTKKSCIMARRKR